GDIAYPLPDCGTQEGSSIKDNLKALLDPDSNGELTVKDALDTLLCQLNADSLPYEIPDCATGGASVQELLGLTAGGSQVGPVLDKLLCELRANHLPLLKDDDDPLCSELQAGGVVTVQDALRVLCNKSAGGCAEVVSSADRLHERLLEFASSSDETDLSICLKPGTYALDDLPRIAGKRSLRIHGAGREAVTIKFSGDQLSAEADEVILENLSLSFTRGNGQLRIEAATSQTRSCRIARSSSREGTDPMVVVAGRGSTSCRLAWHENILYAQIRRTTGLGTDWASPDVVGDPELSGILLGFSNPDLLANKSAYDEAVGKAAARLISLPKSKRTSWGATVTGRFTDATASPLAITGVGNALIPTGGRVSAGAFSEVLKAEDLGLADAVKAVEDLIVQWVSYTPDYALVLASEQVGGILEGNQVDGWLLLGNGIGEYPDPQLHPIGKTLEAPVVKTGGGDLHLEANRLTAIKAGLPDNVINTDGRLDTRVRGYARLFLAHNHLQGNDSRIVAGSFVGQGNTWVSVKVGSIIADQATFYGNLEEHDDGGFSSTVSADRLKSDSNCNLLINVRPAR
ncbi:MAG: hypothetical protein KDM81_00710, partial [Verrucomicrobiae bacterium]|nr:hypothetical protein [Verrucomicrobiae bacterium]